MSIKFDKILSVVREGDDSATGTVIDGSSASHTIASSISPQGLYIGSNEEGTSYTDLAERYPTLWSVNIGTRNAENGFCSVAIGNSNTVTGAYSAAVGYTNQATADQTFAHGGNNIASGNCAHAEGYGTTASGKFSHAEGGLTSATKMYSHAEGYQTQAVYDHAHAEGYQTVAQGNFAHAEGAQTRAEGGGSHAEGNATVTSAVYSHAEGEGTKATERAQHVEGKYNVEATGYQHIVGGGTNNNNRMNIYTLDWSGNAFFAGKVSASQVDLAGGTTGQVLTKTASGSAWSDLPGGSGARTVTSINLTGIEYTLAVQPHTDYKLISSETEVINLNLGAISNQSDGGTIIVHNTGANRVDAAVFLGNTFVNVTMNTKVAIAWRKIGNDAFVYELKVL